MPPLGEHLEKESRALPKLKSRPPCDLKPGDSPELAMTVTYNHGPFVERDALEELKDTWIQWVEDTLRIKDVCLTNVEAFFSNEHAPFTAPVLSFMGTVVGSLMTEAQLEQMLTTPSNYIRLSQAFEIVGGGSQSPDAQDTMVRRLGAVV